MKFLDDQWMRQIDAAVARSIALADFLNSHPEYARPAEPEAVPPAAPEDTKESES